MFDKMKELLSMQKKMQEMKRQLEKTVFEVSSSDGMVTISMNGSQEVQSVTIKDNFKDIDKARFEQAVKDAFNKSVKRSQEVAAKQMKDVVGFNIPGLT